MPSNAILEQKQKIVAGLVAMLKDSSAGVLINYQGITVDDDTKMRKALREAGVKYMVMKNSLTSIACDQVGLSDMKPFLSGMTAIAIGSDNPVAPAKVLKEYAEKIESFTILSGYLDGKVVSKDTVLALADIPSKETLIAKFLGSIKSPIYGLAYALQAVVDRDGQSTDAPVEA